MFYTDWYDVLGSKMLSMRVFENLPQNIAADVDFYANNKNQRRPISLDMSMMLESLFDVFLRNKQDDKIVSVVKSALTELGTAIRLNTVYRKAITEDKKSVVKFAALFSLVFGTNSNLGFCEELYPALTKGQVEAEISQHKRAIRFEKQRLAMKQQEKTK